MGFRGINRASLAAKVFGAGPFSAALAAIRSEARSWGYGSWLTERELPDAIAALLLVGGSPYFEDITPATVAAVMGEQDLPWYLGLGVGLVARTLVKLGIFPASALPSSAVGTTRIGGTGLLGLKAPGNIPIASNPYPHRGSLR